MPWTVLPSGSVPEAGRLSATAAQRSVSPGRPSRAKISEPCAIIAGVWGAGDRLPSRSIQRSTVSIPPLAQTCCIASSARRANHPEFPAR